MIQRNARTAFTLLEVMLAMTIGILILGALLHERIRRPNGLLPHRKP